MKKIQIDTTHNVKVQYQLAGLAERFLAWLIDLCVIACIILFISIFMVIFSLIDGLGEALYGLLFWLVLGFYSPVMESLNNGRTVGKMAMSLRVVKLNGEKPTVFDFLSRWSTKGVEVLFTFGSLAGIVSFLSDKGQRIGDILANTVVIKQEAIGRLNFSKVLELDKYANYEPRFPEITQLKEEDVLLLHEAYNRYRKDKTSGHTKALELLVKSVKQKLMLDDKIRMEDFCRQAIKDYVILTR